MPIPNDDAERPPTSPTYTHTHASGSDSVPGNENNNSSADIVNYSKRPSPPNFLFIWTSLVYYRIYAEDGAILSKTPVDPSDPFLGRIKAKSVPPPHTVKTVKRRIAKMEDIKDPTSTSLFLTTSSQKTMSDADKVAILKRSGPGSTPQEPLALVAKLSESERSTLESGRRGGLNTSAEPHTTLPDIQYRSSIQYSSTFIFVLTSSLLWKVYYHLYSNDCDIPSKVAFDAEEPSLGRIRCDSVAPPHTPASIKRRISRAEETPELANADLFADISSETPMKDCHISILGTDGPGLSPNEPMAIVQTPIDQVQSPSIPDGRYIIKSRAGDLFWNALTDGRNSMKEVRFYNGILTETLDYTILQVRSILQLFKCSKNNSLYRSGTSYMILVITSP